MPAQQPVAARSRQGDVGGDVVALLRTVEQPQERALVGAEADRHPAAGQRAREARAAVAIQGVDQAVTVAVHAVAALPRDQR